MTPESDAEQRAKTRERIATLEERSLSAGQAIREISMDVREVISSQARLEVKMDHLLETSGHRISARVKAGIGAGGVVGVATAVGALLKSLGLF